MIATCICQACSSRIIQPWSDNMVIVLDGNLEHARIKKKYGEKSDLRPRS